MLDVVWLIPALPLAGFLLILLLGRRLGDPKAGYLATAMIGASFAVTVGVFFDLLSKSAEEREHISTVFSWVPVGSLKVDMAFLADPLSITMCLFVTGIGTLIRGSPSSSCTSTCSPSACWCWCSARTCSSPSSAGKASARAATC
jgi:NADH-quinone oxidoreductase subunit L